MACQLTVRRKLRCEKRCGLHLLLFSIEISIRRGANCLFRSHLHFSLSLCAVLIRPFCPDVYKIMVKERALWSIHFLPITLCARGRERKFLCGGCSQLDAKSATDTFTSARTHWLLWDARISYVINAHRDYISIWPGERVTWKRHFRGTRAAKQTNCFC